MNFECYSYVYYIYTRKRHQEDNSVWESSIRGNKPRDSSFMGRSPDGKVPLPLMSKGERSFICMERDLNVWREKKCMFPEEQVLQCCIRVLPSMPKGDIVD
jgi:hypothetical protein